VRNAPDLLAFASDTLTGRRRHTIFQCSYVIVIDRVCRIVAGCARAHLLNKALALIRGLIELRECVSQLPAANI